MICKFEKELRKHKMEKFVFAKGTLKERLEEYFSCKEKGKRVKFLALVDRQSLAGAKNFDWVVTKYKNLGVEPQDLAIAVNNNFCKKTFSTKELAKLYSFEKRYKNMGIKFGVYDYTNIYSFSKVQNADKIIKEIAKETKSHNYSPLENLLSVYSLISNRPYVDINTQFGNYDQQISVSRSVYGVLNSNKIVCVGYSNLLRAVLDEIDDPNLKVFQNDVGCLVDYGFKFYSLHQNNIVYIKDEKYGIDGYYVQDLTKDSKLAKDDDSKFNNFMIDMDNLKKVYDYTEVDFRNALQRIINSSKKLFEEEGKIFSKKIVYPIYPSVVFGSAKLLKFGKENSKTEQTFAQFLARQENFKTFVMEKVLSKYDESKININKQIAKFYVNFKKHPKKYLNQSACNSKMVFEFLQEHSKPITLGQILNAIYFVSKTENPQMTKDELSKLVFYKIYNKNRIDSKAYFAKGSTMPFRECNIETDEKM